MVVQEEALRVKGVAPRSNASLHRVPELGPLPLPSPPNTALCVQCVDILHLSAGTTQGESYVEQQTARGASCSRETSLTCTSRTAIALHARAGHQAEGDDEGHRRHRHCQTADVAMQLQGLLSHQDRCHVQLWAAGVEKWPQVNGRSRCGTARTESGLRQRMCGSWARAWRSAFCGWREGEVASPRGT